MQSGLQNSCKTSEWPRLIRPTVSRLQNGCFTACLRPSIASSVSADGSKRRAISRPTALSIDRQDKAQAEPSNSDTSDSPSIQSPDVGLLERSLHLESGESSAGFRRGEVQSEDIKKSTIKHRLITGGSVALISALLAKGISEIDSPGSFIASTAAALFAYYLSDFLTGVYHWGVDNYGDGSTPIVGSQIEGFQGHHQKPWTITEREFCNNVHKVFMPAVPFTLACLLVSPWTPSWFDVGIASATFLTCMSQQFHAWAHMKPTVLPAPVKALQENGILVSRKAHGAHHKAPFEGNYCIVSGFWNPILDANGSEKSFFRSLEKLIQEQTGVEPRCWHEPDYSWQEE